MSRFLACCHRRNTGFRRVNPIGTGLFLAMLPLLGVHSLEAQMVDQALVPSELATEATSVLQTLTGFDQTRLQRTFPAVDDDSVGEMAKLLFRLGRINAEQLNAKDLTQPKSPDRSPEAVSGKLAIGDAVQLRGRIDSIRKIPVPDDLVAFLEIRQLQQISLLVGEGESDEELGESSVNVFTTGLPTEASPGDHLIATGGVVSIGQNARDSLDSERSRPDFSLAVAAASVRWLPTSPNKVGWAMLVEQGVDMSQLAKVANRNRQPLSGDDTEIFYTMLAAADAIGGSPRAVLPEAAAVKPVDLLTVPKRYVGEWVRIDVQTIQVTRIAVSEPLRQNQLGSDHYYQIDAVGDLGNVVIKLDPPDGSDGQPAFFQNRYPVSLVCKTLPEFLREQIESDTSSGAIVAAVSLPVSVDAFFFRLWSYSSEYMRQYGNDDQFGPLLIAAEITNRETSAADPAGVKVIGWFAAIASGLSILGVIVWSRVIALRDRKIEQRRRDREAEQINFPS